MGRGLREAERGGSSKAVVGAFRCCDAGREDWRDRERVMRKEEVSERGKSWFASRQRESYSCKAWIRYLIIVRLGTISLIIKRRASRIAVLPHATLLRFASLRDLRGFTGIE